MFDREKISGIADEIKDGESQARSMLASDTARISKAAKQVNDSWSGSSLGHHGSIYYGEFTRPPRAFNVEWGTQRGMPPGWSSRHHEDVTAEIARLSGVDLERWQEEWDEALTRLKDLHASLLIELSFVGEDDQTSFKGLLAEITRMKFDNSRSNRTVADTLNAHRAMASRDFRAITAGHMTTPSQVFFSAIADEIGEALADAVQLAKLTERLLRGLELAEQARKVRPLTEEELMSLRSIANNPFVLVKADGTRVAFKGVLSDKKLVTFEAMLPVADNDLIERTLPGDRTERFVVVDAVFYSGMSSIPANYQIKVRKEGAAPEQRMASTVTNIYNVHGPNSRVNLHAVDSSQNIANIGEVELFEKIRSAVEAGVQDSQQRGLLLDSIAEMAKSKGTPAFSEHFQKLLSNAANCMTILTPFLPALSQLAVSALS